MIFYSLDFRLLGLNVHSSFCSPCFTFLVPFSLFAIFETKTMLHSSGISQIQIFSKKGTLYCLILRNFQTLKQNMPIGPTRRKNCNVATKVYDSTTETCQGSLYPPNN